MFEGKQSCCLSSFPFNSYFKTVFSETMKHLQKTLWLYFKCNSFRSKRFQSISNILPVWFWPWFQHTWPLAEYLHEDAFETYVAKFKTVVRKNEKLLRTNFHQRSKDCMERLEYKTPVCFYLRNDFYIMINIKYYK